MVPDASLRLKTVLKALDDVIGPALPDDAVLAQEQLSLARRSIELAIEQIPLELAYIVTDARDDRELARALLPMLDPADPEAGELERSVAASEAALPADPPDIRRIREGWRGLKVALENAVTRLGKGRDAQARSDLARTVLAYSERRNIRERAWVAATGFDPAPDKLPNLEQAALATW